MSPRKKNIDDDTQEDGEKAQDTAFDPGDIDIFFSDLDEIGGIEVIEFKDVEDSKPNSTGSYALDVDLVTPFPEGGIIEVYGDEGSGKCIDKDSLVLSSLGLVRIETMYEDGVESSSPNRHGEYKNIQYYYDNGESDVIHMKTSLGNGISATPNHRVLTWNGGYKWSRMDKLSHNDYIVIPRSSRFPDRVSNLSDEDAYIYGLLIGDGTLGDKSRVGLTSQDKELVDEFRSFAARNDTNVKSYGIDHHINSSAVRATLEIPLCKSHDKRIPDVILTSSESNLCQFIAGLWDADGSVDRSATLSSVSKNLLLDVQTALMSIGVISSLSKKNGKYNGKPHISYRLYIVASCLEDFYNMIPLKHLGKSSRLLELLDVERNTNLDVIPGVGSLVERLLDKVPNWRSFLDDIEYNFIRECYRQSRGSTKGISLQRIKRLVKLFGNLEIDAQELEFLYELVRDNPFICRVVSLEKGVAHTYDVHVPDGHEFVANGIINHNTTLVLEAIGQAVCNGKVALFVDQERALQRSLVRSIRTLRPYVDAIFSNDKETRQKSPIKLVRADSGEKALEAVRRFASSFPGSIIAVDSVDALVPEAKMTENIGKANMGSHAKLMSEALRILVHDVGIAKSTVMFLNQKREKVGLVFGNPETTSGGRGLKFYSWQRIELLKPGNAQRISNADKDVVGHRVRYKIIKNKTAPTAGAEGDFPILYGKGIFRELELVDQCSKYGVIKSGGRGGKQVVMPIATKVTKDDNPVLDEDGNPQYTYVDKTMSKFNASRYLLIDSRTRTNLEEKLQEFRDMMNVTPEDEDEIQDSAGA